MRSVKTIAPVLVALAVMGFLFSRLEAGDLLGALHRGDKTLLLLGLVPLCLAHVFSIWRWKSLVGAYGVNSRFGEMTKIYFANLSVAKWSPMYSGDFLRAVYLKEKLPQTEGAAIILLESIIDVFVLLLFVLGSALWSRELPYVGIAGTGILFLFGVIYLVSTPMLVSFSRISAYAVRISAVFQFFRRAPGAVFLTFLITVLSWLQISIFIKIMFLAFGYPEVSFFYVLTAQPLVTLFSLLPVTLGGLGTREGAMLFFYTAFVAAPVVFLISLLYSTMSLIVFPFLGLLIGFSEIKKLFHAH